jgi:hypothetical protein
MGVQQRQNSGVAGATGNRKHNSLERFLQKTRLCVFHSQGLCTKGSKCSFAHGEEELASQPNLSNTRLCEDFQRDGKCENPNCTYAHEKTELRSTDFCFKTSLCVWHISGKCRNGTNCRFAHGNEELRLKAPESSKHVVVQGQSRMARKEQRTGARKDEKAGLDVHDLYQSVPENIMATAPQPNGMGHPSMKDGPPTQNQVLSNYALSLDEQTIHQRTLEYMRNPEYANFVDSIISAANAGKVPGPAPGLPPPGAAAPGLKQVQFPPGIPNNTQGQVPVSNAQVQDTANHLSHLARMMSDLSSELVKLEARMGTQIDTQRISGFAMGKSNGTASTTSRSSPVSSEAGQSAPSAIEPPLGPASHGLVEHHDIGNPADTTWSGNASDQASAEGGFFLPAYVSEPHWL